MPQQSYIEQLFSKHMGKLKKSGEGNIGRSNWQSNPTRSDGVFSEPWSLLSSGCTSAPNGGPMPCKQGDLALLQHPTSQELLHSKIPARLAYVALDGTPRVIPIWFHWTRPRHRHGLPAESAETQGARPESPKSHARSTTTRSPHKAFARAGGLPASEPLDGICLLSTPSPPETPFRTRCREKPG